MRYISSDTLEQYLEYPELISHLRNAFQSNYWVPQRHHHEYKSPASGLDSTLLLMPAWMNHSGKTTQTNQPDRSTESMSSLSHELLSPAKNATRPEETLFGVKLVTVSPKNKQFGLPSIQGVYLLFKTITGELLLSMDAQLLTAKRTAAASALAASYLSRSDSNKLLMVGTGTLAPHLIQAHLAIRPIEKVIIWGRNFEKAKQLAQILQAKAIHTEAIANLSEAVPQADIISCATMSKTPLIQGHLLRPGQHLDLVGSYKPDMREADDQSILRASIFVDSDAACHESGDLCIPLQNESIHKNDIKADLFKLCKGTHPGRINEEEITLFKSVGHGLEDLAAAALVYTKLYRST